MLLTIVLIVLLVLLLSGKGAGWNRAEPIGLLVTILLVVLLVMLILSLVGFSYPVIVR